MNAGRASWSEGHETPLDRIPDEPGLPPEPEPALPVRALKQRVEAAEKAARAWEERCVEAEGRLSAANAQARLWQGKYDDATKARRARVS